MVIKAFPSRDCSDTPRPNDQPYRDAQRRALNTIVVGRKRSGESDLEKYVGEKFGRAMVGHWKRNLRPVKVPTLWCVGVFHLQNYRMRLIQLQSGCYYVKRSKHAYCQAEMGHIEWILWKLIHVMNVFIL